LVLKQEMILKLRRVNLKPNRIKVVNSILSELARFDIHYYFFPNTGRTEGENVMPECYKNV
jgi:hypothetical protein